MLVAVRLIKLGRLQLVKINKLADKVRKASSLRMMFIINYSDNVRGAR